MIWKRKRSRFIRSGGFGLSLLIIVGVAGSSGEETPQTDDKTQVEAGATDENSAPVANVDEEGNEDSISTEQQPVEEKEPEKEVADVPTEYKSAFKKSKNI